MSLSLANKIELAVSLCRDERLSDAQFRVAIAMLLYFHNTKTGACYPSYSQLASAACTTKRTAQRTTERLKEMGVIDFERSSGGRKRRNRYMLTTVTPAQPLEQR